jgi:NCAIR mutase (PurE)-related protein
VTANEAKHLLEKFRDGKATLAKTLQAFQAAPFKDINFAKVDTHRGLRNGFPEVVFGLGKTTPHIVCICEQLARKEKRFLVTRVSAETAKAVKRRVKGVVYYDTARALVVEKVPVPKRPGTVAVLCAGTSDLPVAEEAVVTAEVMGNRVERIYDVGVAGLHRLLGQIDAIQSASVLVVVAGMEGALPSVVAGLVSRPVIAVPTSVGYGANFGGLAALLTMLNSCGSGVTVVNIDNGFGAAYAASQINALAADMK